MTDSLPFYCGYNLKVYFYLYLLLSQQEFVN